MMKSAISTLLLAGAAQAAPALSTNDNNNKVQSFSTPGLLNLIPRALEIEEKRKGWLYGTFPFGVAPYPYGKLADKVIADDRAIWAPPVFELGATIVKETKLAAEGVIAAGGFNSLDDYYKVYENQWTTSLPDGPLPGMLTNHTDDRTFSMMRLSSVPYRLHRVKVDQPLLFPVDDEVVKSITGQTLEGLHAQGRLFSEDFAEMRLQEATPAYGAGCQAYFYIDDAGDFLPLAIKLIVKDREDSALVYTPKDIKDEWLFAKMTINANDGWHSTWGHTTLSHASAEAPYLAAIRSLSDNHPVMGLLQRIENTPWSIRPNLEDSLVNGTADNGPKYYPWTANAARAWANQVYSSGEVSNFSSNYFRTSLINRGLIDYEHGPALKSFPFYEDGLVLMEIIEEFFSSVIDSYYKNDKAIANDRELQAWLKETVPGQVHDFPKKISTKKDIVGILSHQAYLGSIVHTVMSGNGNQLDIMALPFTAAGWQQPIPTKKGVVTDIVSWMPTPQGAAWQVATYAAGNRAAWKDTNQTLAHMFDEPALLNRMNKATKVAAAKFKADMFAVSDQWRTRGFDENGLDRGMPYLWNVLDPRWAIYWSVV
ncbi:putative manganese lipoxygenase protein [Rosellinia necatrix]|uniref:Manganese lipoxygenase n=1 Tax=Rosellinia necatrix TaxID=77044 RepID=A0A1W2TV75_ROSNE|nr:putative manganese lipoxygenase protein [Rosellinia necatrix]